MSAVTIVSAAVEINPDLHPEYAPVVVIKGGTSADYGNYFLQLIAGGLLYLAGPVAIIVIAVAGLRYVTSHGNQEAIDGAKKTLQWAIIGLIIIILSYAAVRVVITTVLQTDQTSPGQSVTKPTPPATPTPPPSGDTGLTPDQSPIQPHF